MNVPFYGQVNQDFSKFRQDYPFEQRKDISTLIATQYPNNVPVVVERHHNSPMADLDRQKFIAPGDITVAKFISEMRKKLKLGRQEGMFVYVGNNAIPQPNQTMSQVFNKHKDADGFLYVVYSSENVLGADRKAQETALSRIK